MKFDVKRDAAVIFIMGQSNAAGHFLPMTEEEKLLTPLKNVFGLPRELNQSLDNPALHWAGWTSGGMNLAESYDHSWSPANCLAAEWQAELDGGTALPDLYIVHLAMGAHGVTKKYMWYPDREPVMEPGGPWQSNISLFPFGVHLLSLLNASLEARGKRALFLGLHWMGGENDVTEPMEELERVLAPLYRRLFGGFRAAAGAEFPVILHTILECPECGEETEKSREGRRRSAYINEVFDLLAREEKNITVFDRRRAPCYNPADPLLGMFLEDRTHYTAEVNRWTAAEILKAAKGEE